jgi:hypothetical protein
MAGTLTISTLKDSSGVLATQNGMTGIAKAWVNFNGTGTVAIRSSFNVSSITDNGTGNYTINFSTAMHNANYCPVVGGDFAQGSTLDNGMYLPTNFNFSTSSLQIGVTNSAGAFTDIDTVLIAILSS